MPSSRYLRFTALVLGTQVAVTAAVVPAFATDAAPRLPAGHLMTVRQNTFADTLRVTGWAYDPEHPRASVRVRVLVDGSLVRTIRADQPSARANQIFGLSGAHGYSVSLPRTKWARTVTVRSRGFGGGPVHTLASRRVTHYAPPPGARIISVAKQYVGARYVEGGATPRGFDCSGYTSYVYAQANVQRLAHNAQAQLLDMRRVSRSGARPGDLVFYLSGGSAYHVAVYAGHGWQYSAATPRDGVRYQRVWSSAVRYGTGWH